MFEEIGALSHFALNILGIAGTGLYAGLVAVGYVTEGPSYHFGFDVRNPFRCAERLLVGLGVRATGTLLKLAQSTLDMLFEASAEVGEWFTRRTTPAIQEHIRSRFL